MEQIVIISIMLLTFFGYLGYVVKKFGVTASISESYYELPNNLQWMFTWFCFILGISTIILGNTAYFWVAGFALTLVGTATEFKVKQISKVHYIGAITAIVFSQLSLFFDFNLIYPICILLASILSIALFVKSNIIWWIEVSAFLITIFSLICIELC